MEKNSSVLEFKCPCCNAVLTFEGQEQQMKCAYCDNTFDLDTLQAVSESEMPEMEPEVSWEEVEKPQWTNTDQTHIRSFRCNSCAGELITDNHSAATFCPYCGNAAIIPDRVSGGLKPEGVIPFKTTRDDAKAAFLKLCRGKPLLPKFFTQEQQIQKLTGIYVPFWLYDCSANIDGSYRATRIHTWADNRYTYTKTDHYLLRRRAEAAYSGIPMDGSSKMEDTFMESIEPYDYSELKDFELAYLSGYLADKYDVASRDGEPRIRQRVDHALNERLQSSFLGYATVLPASRQIRIDHSRAKYVLLPVWILNTQWHGKTYTFAMNGQTGKMTGSFPACPKRTAAWFGGIWAAAAAVISLIQLIL